MYTALTLHKRNGRRTWHVTIACDKTHKWKQLDSVLKGQTSYCSHDTLWHPPFACVFNHPKIGNYTQETETRQGSEGLKKHLYCYKRRKRRMRHTELVEVKNKHTDRRTEISVHREERRKQSKKKRRDLRFGRWGFRSFGMWYCVVWFPTFWKHHDTLKCPKPLTHQQGVKY
jgi:hypothetical protein